jgi:hypothetical protein
MYLAGAPSMAWIRSSCDGWTWNSTSGRLQEIRRLQPSTVSRRLSVVIGSYRTCVIDAVFEHSPADYVCRPTVAPQSPTLGLSHLQFEAMLSTAGLRLTRTTSPWSRCSASASCEAAAATIGDLCRTVPGGLRGLRPRGCRPRRAGACRSSSWLILPLLAAQPAGLLRTRAPAQISAPGSRPPWIRQRNGDSAAHRRIGSIREPAPRDQTLGFMPPGRWADGSRHGTRKGLGT